MNEYLKKRYRKRRKEALEFLGGICAKCETKENLQLDHINRNSKEFDIGRFWGTTLERFWAEVKKCQILCKPCHIIKTGNEVLAKHGTISRYAHRKTPCRCKLCIQAMSIYRKAWRKKRRVSER
mgnify:FL=1